MKSYKEGWEKINTSLSRRSKTILFISHHQAGRTLSSVVHIPVLEYWSTTNEKFKKEIKKKTGPSPQMAWDADYTPYIEGKNLFSNSMMDDNLAPTLDFPKEKLIFHNRACSLQFLTTWFFPSTTIWLPPTSSSSLSLLLLKWRMTSSPVVIF